MQETDHLRIHNAEERKAGAGAEPRRTERKEEEKESDWTEEELRSVWLKRIGLSRQGL